MDNMNLENFLREKSQRIYEQIGSGYPECVYHTCLMRELLKVYPNIEREKNISVIYTDVGGHAITVSNMRIDIFITHNGLSYIVELKSTMKPNITCIEKNQVYRYIDMLQKNYHINVTESFIINFPQPGTNTIPDEISFEKL
jgi:GxxExxY protein